MQRILRVESIEASKEHNTRGMQYIAQMTKPTIDKPQPCQNKGQNMLKWLSKSLDKHAYVLAHKQGIRHNSQKH